MANKEHIRIFKQGSDVWNKWRGKYPGEIPDLSGADLRRIVLVRANLTDAVLREADLTGANLPSASLHRADLRGANLSHANLIRADLTGASLDGADLSSAILLEASLEQAKLVRADLTGAALSAADLTGADLSGAILYGALLDYTRLGDLDLTSVIGLENVRHLGPSIIGIDTLYKSRGQIPEVFLRGIGVPDTFIQYIPSLVEQPIQFYSVFISYSHKDKAFAKRLYDALQGSGIRCWLDEHQLLPGDKIAVGIDRGIRLWDKVLLCCSKDSLKSWWVENEVNLAIQKEQRLHKERREEVLALIPLNLDGFMFSDEWESGWKGQITSRLAPNFTGWQRSHKKFEQQLEGVVKALRADAGARGVVPPSML